MRHILLSRNNDLDSFSRGNEGSWSTDTVSQACLAKARRHLVEHSPWDMSCSAEAMRQFSFSRGALPSHRPMLMLFYTSTAWIN
jgi:hypothetical protein